MRVQTMALGLLMACLFGCTEIGPVITSLEPGSPGSGGQSAPQMVLIEEFSGVRCVNCPAGSAELEQLAKIYPGRLVVVSIHAGFFSNPYAENRYDFRTAEGNNLINLLGQPLGYPSAVINRKKFEGETDLQLSRTQWAGFIAQELNKTSTVDLKVTSTFNAGTRELRADVDVKRLDNLADPGTLRLSVFLTENDIQDTQLTPEGKKDDYLHRHVLRKALTPFDGAPVGGELTAVGVSVRRSFVFTMPQGWRPEACMLVAAVHRSGDSWEVLQAAGKSL
ncbi:MAG: Omp28-related outer membrane protein [Haliscomenobacter sp.]|nr:Omp28-related outer membrane protein [Haliscomenobacter sp.]